MFGNCLEGVGQVSGGCLEGVLRVSGRCLVGVLRVFGGCPKGVWKVSDWCLQGCLEGTKEGREKFQNQFGPKIFFDQKDFWTLHFLGPYIFLDKKFGRPNVF